MVTIYEEFLKRDEIKVGLTHSGIGQYFSLLSVEFTLMNTNYLLKDTDVEPSITICRK